VIQYHPHRTGANLRRKLVRCLAHKDSIYSRVGASDNPGAVQCDARMGPIRPPQARHSEMATASRDRRQLPMVQGMTRIGLWL